MAGGWEATSVKEEIALMNRRLASISGAFAVAVAVAGLTAASAGASTAAPTATEYPASGTAHIHKADANMTLGPGGLETLYPAGSSFFYGGRLTLPNSTLSFTEGGNAVTATVAFDQTTPLTGTVSSSGAVSITAPQTLTVTKLSVAGSSVAVGTTCQTIKPVQLTATSAAGFSLTSGGNLTARYAIPPFENCGTQGDTVLNAAVPGPANTATLTLGPGANSTPGTNNDDILAGVYPFNGSTLIHRSGATVTLGPGDLYALPSVHDGGVYGGDLVLPPGSGTATLHGKTVTITAAFIQVGPISGTLNLQTGAVASTAQETIQVTNVTVNGQNVPVPATCQTVKPVVIHAATTSGFNVLQGGTLEAPSYKIPAFTGCGQATKIVAQGLPGPGNSLTLTLGALSVFP
jgi:hypothetical protein